MRTCLPREWIISRFRPMFAPKAGDYPLSSSKRPKILARDLFYMERILEDHSQDTGDGFIVYMYGGDTQD